MPWVSKGLIGGVCGFSVGDVPHSEASQGMKEEVGVWVSKDGTGSGLSLESLNNYVQ